MDSVIKENKDKTEKKSEDVYRIGITKTAEKALSGVLEKVNRDFVAGQINRSQLASWIVKKFAETFGSDEIREIRAEHVDEFTLLEHYYRQAKESGKVEPEVRDLIRKLAGIEGAQKRPQKKGLQNSINDGIRDQYDNRDRHPEISAVKETK